MTDILKPCGMRYFTGRSLYKPEDPDRRDDIMYDAMKLLSRCEWIDNKNVGIFVIDDIIHFLRREMLDFTAFPVFFVSNLLLVQRKKYYFNRATVSRNCSIVL